MINILFIIGSLSVGGAERQVVEIIKHLDKNIFNVHIAVFNDCDNGFKDRLPLSTNYFVLNYSKLKFFNSLFKLKKYILQNKIEIVHSHMYLANKIGALVSFFSNVKFFVTGEHGKNTWKKWHHHLWEKYIIDKVAQKRIAVSNDIAQLRIRYDGVDPKKLLVIQNGTQPLANRCDPQKKPKIIGSMGRLISAKDFPTLIHAFALLHAKGFRQKLKIAGNGLEFNNLNNLIQELGLEGVIQLIGFADADTFLSSIDIFVMSSLSEGIPLALLEAMAYGLPVIATSVGGIPDVITHNEDGLLCPSGNSDCIALFLEKLIVYDDLRCRLSINASNKINEQFSISKTTSLYSKLYIDGIK